MVCGFFLIFFGLFLTIFPVFFKRSVPLTQKVSPTDPKNSLAGKTHLTIAEA